MADDAVDLTAYLSLVWRRRSLITVVGLAVFLGVGLLTALTPPRYQTRAFALVPDPDATHVLAVYAETPPAMLAFVARLQQTSPGLLRGDDTLVAVPLGAGHLVAFQVSGQGAARVARLATLWARSAVAESRAHGVITSPGPVRVVSDAPVPNEPLGLPLRLTILLIAILGLIAGLVAAAVVEALAGRVRSAAPTDQAQSETVPGRSGGERAAL